MEVLVKGVTFDAMYFWVEFADGRILGVPLVWYPRLLNATPAQREQWVLGGAGRGIHWAEIDEDISAEGLLAGRGDQTRRKEA